MPARRRGLGRVDTWLTVAAAIGAGVSAGAFFAFSAIVMPALRQLPPEQGIAAMQATNRTAVMAPFMLAMFGTTVLCVVLAVRAATIWRSPAAPWLFGGAVAFVLATVIITGAGNLPVSDSIDLLQVSGATAAARWDELYSQWTWWNHLRTFIAVGATGALALALRPPVRSSS